MDEFEYSRYVRKPFPVKAFVITEDNIEQVAALLGELKTKGDEKFISLDRRIVPSVGRAWVGWYVTVFGDNYRCYSPKIFNEQFVEMDGVSKSITFEFEDEDGPGVVVG